MTIFAHINFAIKMNYLNRLLTYKLQIIVKVYVYVYFKYFYNKVEKQVTDVFVCSKKKQKILKKMSHKNAISRTIDLYVPCFT